MINYNLQGLKIILIIINFRYNNYWRYYMNKKVIFFDVDGTLVKNTPHMS